jgi:hypothetical protein
MANLGNFDANTVEPAVALEAIPAGKYMAMIVDSGMKPNKAGTGQYLELVFQILEGDFKGRQLWARLNLKNPNELTMRIALAELSAICRAVGVMTPGDSCELHNLPMIINVRCKKRSDSGEIGNEIRGYEKRDSASGKPQQATTNTPPWRR